MNEPTLDLRCEDAAELAGLYVLDALEADEHAAVRRHLETCALPHPEFEEVGAVVPALAATIDPIEPPPALRARVLDAIAAESGRTARPAAMPVSVVIPGGAGIRRDARDDVSVRARMGDRSLWRSWSSLGMAAAVVLVIAVLGAWSIVLQGRAIEAEERMAVVADAIRASAQPDARVAMLDGVGSAEDASGFAVFTDDGQGYIVLVGLPEAPAGHSYQAWSIVGGEPLSAGVMRPDENGVAVMRDVTEVTGTDLIAVTIEPFGGVEQPTTEPILAGSFSA